MLLFFFLFFFCCFFLLGCWGCPLPRRVVVSFSGFSVGFPLPCPDVALFLPLLGSLFVRPVASPCGGVSGECFFWSGEWSEKQKNRPKEVGAVFCLIHKKETWRGLGGALNSPPPALILTFLPCVFNARVFKNGCSRFVVSWCSSFVTPCSGVQKVCVQIICSALFGVLP